jgi:8-oxo-dGTP pyrophosphatase MutT (NUDIX family)
MRDAAAREAREEAGVEGRIECDAFATYSYPSSHADSPPVTVDAFLLEVRRSSTHGESGRQPTWLLPDQAIAKLSENREARFGEEAERVIREAERKLVGSRS